jgi:hypothetical protein
LEGTKGMVKMLTIAEEGKRKGENERRNMATHTAFRYMQDAAHHNL